MVNLAKEDHSFELGLIGKPLGHSFSASYFNEKFKREHLDGRYSLFPLDSIKELTRLVNDHSRLTGLNVTIPYKQQVLEWIDEVSEDVSHIGAVNTIVVKRDKLGNARLVGHNTDWIGFKESVEPLLHSEITKALILGTGGASKAVFYALRRLGIEGTFVSRFPEKASLINAISYSDISKEILETHPLVVNTTPVGMFPDMDSCPPIPYNLLSSSNVCYDLIYNPEQTMFMKLASAHNAIVKNGLEMLHLQAEAAWKIWLSEMSSV